MNKMKSLIFFITLFVLGIKGESKQTSIVQTDKGPVRGEILRTVENSLEYAAFKGIPYAEPPLHYLRFKPPVEKKPWKSVLETTTEGSICTQYNETDSSIVGSEDCLFLNVFTPHTYFDKSTLKPVMVWIHGGAFRTGNANASYYGPDFLLEGNVVVVSLNYRLGPFGFLNLNHDNATGNAGLKDQNLALQWVQKNIASFGGDPAKVTIFGQSAGSVSVDLHILSEMSAGLFSQSISMSGTPLCLYWGFQTSVEAQKQAFLLGSKLGTNTLSKDTLLEAFYSASANDIINKTSELPLIPFRPTIENAAVAKHEKKFLTDCTVTKYVTGDFNKGPHMMGFTSSEITAFAGSASKLMDMVHVAFDYVKAATLSIDFPFLTKITEMTVNEIANLKQETMEQLVAELSDIFFVTGIDMKQKLFNVHNKHPVYYYRYSFDPEYSAHRSLGVDLNGAGHEDELPYVFYRPHLEIPLDHPEIELTRRRIVHLWTNFAKYGNPTPIKNNGALEINWPDSGYLGKYLEIGQDLFIGFVRPTDLTVKAYQIAGLGASPILNDCSTSVINSVLNGVKNIFNYIKN